MRKILRFTSFVLKQAILYGGWKPGQLKEFREIFFLKDFFDELATTYTLRDDNDLTLDKMEKAWESLKPPIPNIPFGLRVFSSGFLPVKDDDGEHHAFKSGNDLFISKEINEAINLKLKNDIMSSLDGLILKNFISS